MLIKEYPSFLYYVGLTIYVCLSPLSMFGRFICLSVCLSLCLPVSLLACLPTCASLYLCGLWMYVYFIFRRIWTRFFFFFFQWKTSPCLSQHLPVFAHRCCFVFESVNRFYRQRQQNQKLIIQLEQRQSQEMYEHRKALEREFENQMHTFDKEMERLKSKHRQELEQKVPREL